MKIETTPDVAVTAPLNSEASFRAELEKIRVAEEQSFQESYNEEPVQESRENLQSTSQEELDADGDPRADRDGNLHSDHDYDNDDDIPSNSHLIPKSRFNKQIERRRAAEERAIRAETELNMINQALHSMSQSQYQQNHQQQPQQQQNPFQPLDDEAHAYYNQRYSHQDNRMSYQDARMAAIEQEQVRSRMAETLQQQEASYSKQVPDFDKAYTHLINKEIESHEIIGMTREQAEQYAIYKLQQIAGGALNSGKNVADTFYKMAKAYGYSGSSSKPTPNLSAVESNMRKSSRIADVPTQAVAPSGGGGGTYTTLEQFNKVYKAGDKESKEKFHQLIREARGG